MVKLTISKDYIFIVLLSFIFCDGQFSKDLRYPKKWWFVCGECVVDEYKESWRLQVTYCKHHTSTAGLCQGGNFKKKKTTVRKQWSVGMSVICRSERLRLCGAWKNELMVFEIHMKRHGHVFISHSYFSILHGLRGSEFRSGRGVTTLRYTVVPFWKNQCGNDWMNVWMKETKLPVVIYIYVILVPVYSIHIHIYIYICI